MDPPRRSSAGGGAGAPPHYSPSSSTYPHIQELQQSPQQQQPSMFYADPSNPFVDQPLQYPLHQVHQHQQQPLYPYVAQGGEQMQDAIPAQARDTAATTGSPVSRQSSGIPASRGVSVGGGGSSYPIISTAALDMDSSEHTAAAAAMDLKQQFFLQQQRQRSSAGSPSMMFPDIVLNKDTARGGGVGVVGAPPVVLTAPPVAVTAPKATPSKPGENCLLVCVVDEVGCPLSQSSQRCVDMYSRSLIGRISPPVSSVLLTLTHPPTSQTPPPSHQPNHRLLPAPVWPAPSATHARARLPPADAPRVARRLPQPAGRRGCSDEPARGVEPAHSAQPLQAPLQPPGAAAVCWLPGCCWLLPQHQVHTHTRHGQPHLVSVSWRVCVGTFWLAGQACCVCGILSA